MGRASLAARALTERGWQTASGARATHGTRQRGKLAGRGKEKTATVTPHLGSPGHSCSGLLCPSPHIIQGRRELHTAPPAPLLPLPTCTRLRAVRPRLCLIPTPSSSHRSGSGGRQTPLEEGAPGKCDVAEDVPGEREPCPWGGCGQRPAPGLEPSPSRRKPLAIPPPLPHSLLQELLQPTGLQHEVAHIHAPQLVPSVAQCLVDEQVHGGGTYSGRGRAAMTGC